MAIQFSKISPYQVGLGGGFLFLLQALFCKLLNPVLSRDSVFYLQLVELWQVAGEYNLIFEKIPEGIWVPPLPLFLIKCLADCGISPEVAGVGISIFAGSTLPLLVFLMTQEIQSDKRISLASGLLMTFNPSMIELACEVQRDIIYIAFCGWGSFFALKGLMEKSAWPWIPAGLLGACAILSRYEAMEMLSIGIFAFLILGFKKVLSWKKICQQIVVFALVFTISVVSLVYIIGGTTQIVSVYAKHRAWGQFFRVVK